MFVIKGELDHLEEKFVKSIQNFISGSGPIIPDPDSTWTKSLGSDRIQSHNTDFKER